MIGLVSLVAVLALGTSEQAAAPASEADIDCFLVAAIALGSLGDNPDPQIFGGLVGGAGYFLGRLEGRDPNRDWLAYIGSDPSRFERVAADRATHQRCSAEMSAMGQAMIAWGQSMQDAAQ